MARLHDMKSDPHIPASVAFQPFYCNSKPFSCTLADRCSFVLPISESRTGTISLLPLAQVRCCEWSAIQTFSMPRKVGHIPQTDNFRARRLVPLGFELLLLRLAGTFLLRLMVGTQSHRQPLSISYFVLIKLNRNVTLIC